MAALVFALPAASAPGEHCKRGVEDSDVVFELKGDELKVVVTNLVGDCDLVLQKPPSIGPAKDIASFTTFTMRSAGDVSLGGGVARELTWTPRLTNARRLRQRVAPGGATLFRTNMVSVLRQMEKDAGTRNHSHIPWGEQVVIEVRIGILFEDNDDDPFHPPTKEWPRENDAVSGPLLYQLPENPPK